MGRAVLDTRTFKSTRALTAAFALVLILGACTRDPVAAKQRYLDSAKAYYAKHQYNEAIIDLKNALQIDPKFVPAVHLLSRVYVAKAWHLEAAREQRRLVALQPDNLEAHADLGRTYVKIEAWDDALREAAIIMAKEPASPAAFYLRAAALNAQEKRQDALAAIDKARAGGPPSPEVETTQIGRAHV